MTNLAISITAPTVQAIVALFTHVYPQILLAAAARTPAAHALVATAIPYHDAAADVATGGVSQVDEAGQGVGGVN
jgi:hypothetical protein